MKQFFAGILQNWLKDPQKWLPIDKWSVTYFFGKAEGSSEYQVKHQTQTLLIWFSR